MRMLLLTSGTGIYVMMAQPFFYKVATKNLK